MSSESFHFPRQLRQSCATTIRFRKTLAKFDPRLSHHLSSEIVQCGSYVVVRCHLQPFAQCAAGCVAGTPAPDPATQPISFAYSAKISGCSMTSTSRPGLFEGRAAIIAAVACSGPQGARQMLPERSSCGLGIETSLKVQAVARTPGSRADHTIILDRSGVGGLVTTAEEYSRAEMIMVGGHSSSRSQSVRDHQHRVCGARRRPD
ncbi:hypothetical protein SAMN05519103_09450 [Rhizobiales bacterium GAS113]|nr:hypothetical protein SAMN05519103_09450 [Rhizobiales bacterium GAS113]